MRHFLSMAQNANTLYAKLAVIRRLIEFGFPRHTLDVKAAPFAQTEEEMERIIDVTATKCAEMFVTLHPNAYPFNNRARRSSTYTPKIVEVTKHIIKNVLTRLSKGNTLENSHKKHLYVRELYTVCSEYDVLVQNIIVNNASRKEIMYNDNKNVEKADKLRASYISELTLTNNRIERLNNWNKESLAFKSGKITSLLSKQMSNKVELERNLDLLRITTVSDNETLERLKTLSDTISLDTQHLLDGVLKLVATLKNLLGLDVRKKYANMLKQTKKF